MKTTEVAIPVASSLVLGLIVIEWKTIAQFLGIGHRIIESESVIAPEYWFGLIVVALLGAVFPKRPLHCAIAFMLGPLSVRHIVHLAVHGIPNLWPIEVGFILLLTLPYMAVAYLAARIRAKATHAAA